MYLRSFALGLLLTLLGSTVAVAQDFGIMESAEIIEQGTFKFTLYPVFVFGEDGADDEVGGVLRGGYGFTDWLDGELMVALFDEATLFGGNVEVGLLRAGPVIRGVDLSARAGVHMLEGDLDDATGLDLAAIISTHLTPDLELVGALDFNQYFFDEVDDLDTLHLVPGIEYRLSQRLDLLAEFGVGLNDDAANYLSAGLALYLR